MKINFKEKLLSLVQFIKKVFDKLPVTTIIIFLYTIFLSIIIDSDLDSRIWIQKVLFFGVLFAVGTFFSEVVFENKDKKRYVFYLVSLILSVLFTNYIVSKKEPNMTIIKILGVYEISQISFSLFYIIRKLKKDLSEYILKVLINFTKTTFVYGILSLGIAIIGEIFNYLILDSKGNFLDNIEILIFGFYYVPKMIFSLFDVEEEVNGFFKGLVKYVLMPLITISFIIIYMYILKILIMRDFPKNQIFRILSALFIVGFPIWTSMNYLKDESIISKISFKLPFAFIPFIFLQIYTIGIRISSNGVTPLRYVCVFLIIAEIIYSIFYIAKKQNIYYMILVCGLMLIIGLIVPIINMFDVSNYSQYCILKSYDITESLDNKAKNKVYGAYNYLAGSDDGEEYIKKTLNNEEIEIIEGFSEHGYYRNDSIYVDYRNKNALNIEGYKKLTEVTCYSSDDIDIRKLDFEIELEGESEVVKKVQFKNVFGDLVDELAQNGEEGFNEYIEKHNDIKLDDNSKLIISNIYMNYDIEADILETIHVSGYLLEK